MYSSEELKIILSSGHFCKCTHPGGKQTRCPFNCLGKKMCAGMFPSQGHSDSSQACCFLANRSPLHSFSRIFLDWTAALYLEEEPKRDSSESMLVRWNRTDLCADSLRGRNVRICLEIARPSGNDSFEVGDSHNLLQPFLPLVICLWDK